MDRQLRVSKAVRFNNDWIIIGTEYLLLVAFIGDFLLTKILLLSLNQAEDISALLEVHIPDAVVEHVED